MDPWLQRLRHDLVKRALWPARDLRAALAEGGRVTAADEAALRAGLFDLRAPDGAPCDAVTLLARLRESAPQGLESLLGPLSTALERAQAAVSGLGGGDTRRKAGIERALAALLAVEQEFDALCGQPAARVRASE